MAEPASCYVLRMYFRRPLTFVLGALALVLASGVGAQAPGQETPSAPTPDSVTVLPVPDQQPDLDKLSRRNPLAAPPRFDGLWCGTGLLHEFSLRLTQQHQQAHGTLVRRDRVREIEGRIEGEVLHTQNTKIGSLELKRLGNELRVTGGEGIIALARGATFQLTTADRCSG
jgi:hypothetical protein